MDYVFFQGIMYRTKTVQFQNSCFIIFYKIAYCYVFFEVTRLVVTRTYTKSAKHTHTQ